MAIRADAYFLDAPGTPLARRPLEIAPAADEAVVEVLACGLCHTDLSYASGAVPPRHALPLVLGHEVVGTVVEGPAGLPGRKVIVPAVLPCGDCDLCRSGRANACAAQKMPGNDVHGGFATHLAVPAAPLVPVDDAPPGFPLDELAVVADAVSTAYQAVVRSGLQAGDLALVVGAGGVGGFVVQIAHALGARVVALDIQQERLAAVAPYGADATVSAADPDARKRALGIARELGVGPPRHRIFECSGTPGGQRLAFGLVGRASTLVQVGYSAESVELHLSRLMALDATVHGTWGCPPERYREVLRLVYDGRVALSPFVMRAPMSEVNRLLEDMAAHRLARRAILDPRA